MTADFLFLIPLTPDSASNEIRRELRKRCFAQLERLQATKKVWLLGDFETDHPDFEVVSTRSITKEDKLFEAGFMLEKRPDIARFLVRLDDDDMINPALFDAIARMDDFDAYTDRTHWFYDLSSAHCSAQERTWMPNTIIHRFDHAIQKVKARGGSTLAGDTNFLFACDHSKSWHFYYTGKNVKVADPRNPVYLRILSPKSRSAGGSDDFEKTFPHYLMRFGTWKSMFPFDEEILAPALKDIWTKYEGPLRNWVFPKKSFVSRFLNKIKTTK